MRTDQQVQQDVIDELRTEPSINASRIGVIVQSGIVTLTGTVPSYAEKWAAERAAERVRGVTGVADEMEVNLPTDLQRSDADIAAAAVNTLRVNTLIPSARVKVRLDDGWVTLDGDVDWEYQRSAAEHAVRNLHGVLGVINSITIRPPTKVSPSHVRKEIFAAFQRSAGIDARHVGVDTHDGKVILHGKVRSWSEREEAQRAAWAIPGVVDVENRLVVGP